MSPVVFRGLVLGALGLLFSCQGQINDPKAQAPACDSKQAGQRFGSCATPSATGTRFTALEGQTHAGSRFTVKGSLQGVLR